MFKREEGAVFKRNSSSETFCSYALYRSALAKLSIYLIPSGAILPLQPFFLLLLSLQSKFEPVRLGHG